jgi:hypothetical protein
MDKNLTELKEQYERLGKEIEALEDLDYTLDKLPAGTLVHVPNRRNLMFKVGSNWWKRVEPTEQPLVSHKPNTNDGDAPPISPDQLVLVYTR